jgi:hypothetical protein
MIDESAVTCNGSGTSIIIRLSQFDFTLLDQDDIQCKDTRSFTA